MKKVLLLIGFCVFLCSLNAQVKWDGEGGDGLWSTAANWVADKIPITTDDVLLDNSLVAGNFIVSLLAGNVSTTVNSLSITPGVSNNITLILPSTNTSSAGFTAVGSNDAVI